MDKLIFFGLGFLVARYLILNQSRDEYLQKESEIKDRLQNKMHDLLKENAPNLTDTQIGEIIIRMSDES